MNNDMLLDVAASVRMLIQPPFDAVRVEVLKDGLKVSVSVGWPDEDDEDDEDDE